MSKDKLDKTHQETVNILPTGVVPHTLHINVSLHNEHALSGNDGIHEGLTDFVEAISAVAKELGYSECSISVGAGFIATDHPTALN